MKHTDALPKIKPYVRNGEVMPGCDVPEGIRRIALGIEYNGGPFRGFAKQSHDPETVQGHLEKALSAIACEEITLVCAGRTDSGVHATNQVVHFDTSSDRPMKAWLRGTRAHMPKEIAVLWWKMAGVVMDYARSRTLKQRSTRGHSRQMSFTGPVITPGMPPAKM